MFLNSRDKSSVASRSVWACGGSFLVSNIYFQHFWLGCTWVGDANLGLSSWNLKICTQKVCADILGSCLLKHGRLGCNGRPQFGGDPVENFQHVRQIIAAKIYCHMRQAKLFVGTIEINQCLERALYLVVTELEP